MENFTFGEWTEGSLSFWPRSREELRIFVEQKPGKKIDLSKYKIEILNRRLSISYQENGQMKNIVLLNPVKLENNGF